MADDQLRRAGRRRAVALTGSPWPDIIVAALIAAVFLRSAARVIGSALPTLRAA